MRLRKSFSFMLAVVAALMLAAPALAGGWVVITIDSLPREVRAGEVLHLGFMARQHGKEPNSDLTLILTARKQTAVGESDTKGATTLRAQAHQEGAEGHFVVDVTFPSEGTWAWQVTPEPYGPTTFAPLAVLPAAASVQAEQAAQPLPAAQPAPAVQPASATLAPAVAPPLIAPETLRLAGVLLLAVAALIAFSSLRTRQRLVEVRD
jgi:hypothetical protein